MPQRKSPEPSCLYPDERELAEVLLGKARAHRWPEIAMIEERHGFPRVDPLYGGRHWPSIEAFYARRQQLDRPPETTTTPDENRGETFRDRSRKTR